MAIYSFKNIYFLLKLIIYFIIYIFIIYCHKFRFIDFMAIYSFKKYIFFIKINNLFYYIYIYNLLPQISYKNQ